MNAPALLPNRKSGPGSRLGLIVTLGAATAIAALAASAAYARTKVSSSQLTKDVYKHQPTFLGKFLAHPWGENR